MIKAAIEGKDGRLMLVFGLSRMNCQRLLEGKPILINIEKFPEMALTAKARVIEIAIMGGETEEAIQAELAEFIGVETEVVTSDKVTS